MKKSGYNPVVPAADQAARLLFCLAAHPGSSLTLTRICSEMDIHKSKGFALLHTLMQYDLVNKNRETKTYSLGTGLLTLARHVNENSDLNDIAKPLLKRLSNETSQTVLLGTIWDDRLYIALKVENNEPIGISVRQFQTLHITHGAHGKAIAAFSPPSERERLLNLDDVEYYGKDTTHDPDELIFELKQCERSGYALDNGRVTPGIKALSAPLFDHDNTLCGAIVLLGTFADQSIPEFGPRVFETARDISRNLGARLENTGFANVVPHPHTGEHP